jgi:hypothetical protein
MIQRGMSTGDPICTVCGNYKINCSCNSILRAMLVREAAEPEKTSEGMERLKSPDVAYMEVKKDGFSCKTCSFFKEGYCSHKKIKSNVSPKGCCNFFTAFPDNKVEPRDWKLK